MSASLAFRISALTTACLQGSPTATDDLVYLTRSENLHLKDTMDAVKRLLDRRGLFMTGPAATPFIDGALASFELLTIGLRQVKPTDPIQTSRSLIYDLRDLLPIMKEWISHIINLFLHGQSDSVADFTTFLPVLEEFFGEARAIEQAVPNAYEVHDSTTILFMRNLTRLWLHSASLPSSYSLPVPSLLNVLTSSMSIQAPKMHPVFQEMSSCRSSDVSRALRISLFHVLSETEIDIGQLKSFHGLMLFAIEESSLCHQMAVDGLIPLLITLLFRLTSPRTAIARAERRADAHKDLVKGAMFALMILHALLVVANPSVIETALKCRLLEAVLLAHVRLRNTDEFEKVLMDFPRLIVNMVSSHLIYRSILRACRTNLRRIESRKLEQKLDGEDRFAKSWSTLRRRVVTAIALNEDFQEAVFSRCGNAWCMTRMQLPEYHLKRTPRRCSGCLHVAYCSSECQRVDWKAQHGTYCTSRIRERKDGRLYTTPIPPLDEELLLWLATRDFKESEGFCRQTTTYRGELMVILDYSSWEVQLGECYNMRLEVIDRGAKLWEEGVVEEKPFSAVLQSTQELALKGEDSVLLILPAPNSKTIKYLTSFQQLERRCYSMMFTDKLGPVPNP
ncbi:hypothetical protein BDZ89DRAFT_1078289 [Hymenopellis radicata]|nr:hypothetical protein BDZ89DRAFT_1078289 [Hymenopellis radicata]